MSDAILIAGLPGCGKSRWIASQQMHTDIRLIEWQWTQPFLAIRRCGGW